MSERFIQTDSEVLPYLKKIDQKEAYGKLTARHSTADIDWFVGHPNSLRAHALGYERDEVTPSHHAAVLRRRLWGADETLRGNTLVAYRSLIVPEDLTPDGIETFVHDRRVGRPTAYKQYGQVLINEPKLFGRRTEDEVDYMFELSQTGLTLASAAINYHLNGMHSTALVDERSVPEIQASYEEARERLLLVRASDAERIKQGTRYYF